MPWWDFNDEQDSFDLNQAYQTWLAKNNKSDADSAPTTVGLTGEQIFFVSFAQVR